MDDNIKIVAESGEEPMCAVAYRIGDKKELFYRFQNGSYAVDFQEKHAVFFAGFIAATNARATSGRLDPKPTEPAQKESA